MLGQVGKVRKIVREYLTAVHSDTHVPDLLSLMLPNGGSNVAIAAALGEYTATDGVHLMGEGYSLLADAIDQFIRNKIASAVPVSGAPGTGERPGPFYWRGFASPVGTARPERRGYYHDNRQGGGGKIVNVKQGQSYRGGRNYPPGGRN